MVDVLTRPSTPRSSAIDYLGRLAQTLERVSEAPIGQALELLLTVRDSGRRVYILGNGGNAATASHMACDLARTPASRTGSHLRSYALSDNTALLTAWSNDAAFERSFAAEIDDLAEPGDVVIALCPNGAAPNLVAGLRAAAERGAHRVALVGLDGGEAGRLAEIVIQVPATDDELLEEALSAVTHAITVAVYRAVLEEER